MSIDDIMEHVRALEGVLALTPQAGDGSPEISWGDAFFYYAPDGHVPRAQPFATIVTKDYPDDPITGPGRPDAFRVNIAVGAVEFARLTGHAPGVDAADHDDPVAPADVLAPHPVYGHLGWLAVVNPAERTSGTVLHLLTLAHHAARSRHHRRADAGQNPR